MSNYHLLLASIMTKDNFKRQVLQNLPYLLNSLQIYNCLTVCDVASI